MKVLKKISILGAAAFLLTACSVTRPLAVTDNSIGTKTGSSKTTCLFSIAPAATAGAGFIIASGICLNKNYGMIEAAKDAEITTVGAVDLKETDYYLFKTYELIVAGE
jgi:hypothetical protein